MSYANNMAEKLRLHLQGLTMLWKQVDLHLREDRPDEAREAWNDLVATMVDKAEAPFRDQVWQWLDEQCPRNRRVAAGLRERASGPR